MDRAFSKTIRLILLAIALPAFLGACATTAPMSDPVNDPWEHINRGVFNFNDSIDRTVLRPVAVTYDKVTPRPVKKGIRNFLQNLAYPNTIINLALQGKFKRSAIGTGRFLLNSTVGLGGLFDVATKAEIPKDDEDFGQTLAVWGYDKSRFIMLPLLGPSTFRDGIGSVGDSYGNPISYLAREKNVYSPTIFDIVTTRAGLLATDGALRDAFDPYILIRDAYLQQREYEIYDGDPPLPDYEEFLLGTGDDTAVDEPD